MPAKMRPATRRRSRDSSSPISSLNTSRAGRSSIAITMFSFASVTCRTGPIGEHPCVRPVTTATSGASTTPESPPSTTRSAICRGGAPWAAAMPPTRKRPASALSAPRVCGHAGIPGIAVHDAAAPAASWRTSPPPRRGARGRRRSRARRRGRRPPAGSPPGRSPRHPRNARRSPRRRRARWCRPSAAPGCARAGK